MRFGFALFFAAAFLAGGADAADREGGMLRGLFGLIANGGEVFGRKQAKSEEVRKWMEQGHEIYF